MTEREAFLRAFHAARPGATSRALARTGVYERFAARVPVGPGARVLDLACGDGELLRALAARSPGVQASGVDLSREELACAARMPRVCARASALPFSDASFDAVTCQLAFMLFDDVEQVVAELARVLRPGAPFLALLGGGPTADGDDAFHHFARRLRGGIALGDRRASSEAGWRELFAAWRGDVSFERWPLELGGRFEDVWRFLGASYQLAASEHDRVRDELRDAFPGAHVPCTVACYFARVTR